jgi:biotin carboxyl carrier protein
MKTPPTLQTTSATSSTAPAAGTVKAFCFFAGEQVADGAALVEFETD